MSEQERKLQKVADEKLEQATGGSDFSKPYCPRCAGPLDEGDFDFHCPKCNVDIRLADVMWR